MKIYIHFNKTKETLVISTNFFKLQFFEFKIYNKCYIRNDKRQFTSVLRLNQNKYTYSF